jgi:hypothetical protein
MSRPALLVILLTLCVRPAAAAEVRLEIAGGFVTLTAVDAPLRQILAEWERVGGTRIVNAERVPGPPVTLQLQRVPEQQALAVLLRSAAGYLAAPRRAGAPGASQYESVMILATSTPPAAAPAAAAARAPIGRPMPPPIEMIGAQPPDGGDQGPTEGFITVGNTPAPRQQTPAAVPAGPPATAFPMRPTRVQPGIVPPDGDGPPQSEP